MTSWWDRDFHAGRRGLLLARGRIMAALRTWFTDQGFLEVDPAALQVSPGNETHLHAFATRAIGNDGRDRVMYLHTSPEFAMKKLLAAGETQIFTFAHVWRNRESGPRHHPEFTMLEWYRAGADYTRLMEDCMAVLREAARAAGSGRFRHGAADCDIRLKPERLALDEAFRLAWGFPLSDCLDAAGEGLAAELGPRLESRGLRLAADDRFSDMFSKALLARIEPGLGAGAPLFLDRYPACEAALARRCPDDPRFSERFELFVSGVELANGFGELTDPAEQRRRFEIEMHEKNRIYGETYPLDAGFLAALGQMPSSSGIALGFDRLVMLATGAPRISDVVWTPIEGA
jgi:lysyl-tRNA synthetase class 2